MIMDKLSEAKTRNLRLTQEISRIVEIIEDKQANTKKQENFEVVNLMV